MSSTAIGVRAAPRAGLARPPRLDGWALLLVPGVVFLLLAFGVPLPGMVLRSLTDPSPATYLEVFQNRTFLISMGYTFQLALIVMLACVVLGYPWAYLMHTAGPTLRW